MKKILSFLLSLVLIMSIGMTGTSALASEKVKLVFWDECPGTVQTPLFKELLDEFMELNPDIEVEYVGIPWDSAKEKYDVAIASKATPDVASIHNTWLTEFALKGALMDLDDRFEAWDESSQFNAALIQAIRSEDSEGRLFTIPYTDNMPMLWVRTDLLSAKGVEIPTTWDAFFEAAEKMTDLDKSVYGFTIRGGSGGASQLLHALIAYSGMTSFFDDEGNCLLNNDDAVAFVERLAQMYNVNTAASDITAGLGETVSAFDSGFAAMMFHNLGSYGDHKAVLTDEQFVGIPYPASLEGISTYSGSMWCGYVTFADTEHPEESWRLMQFLASKSSVSRYNEVIGQLPTRTDVSEEAWLNDAPHIKAALEYAAQENTICVNQPTFIPTFSAIVDEMNPFFQETLTGGMTAKEFLDTYAEALEEGYQQVEQLTK